MNPGCIRTIYHFGAQEELVTFAFHDVAENFLGPAVAIGGRRIDKGDSVINRCGLNPVGFFLVAAVAKHHRSKA